ncbi:MAG: bifunctional hydroxymethylpyrimidine kinase/phosphomethylpyrimidine kinase, partial [Desulfurococcaceae archaeon]
MRKLCEVEPKNVLVVGGLDPIGGAGVYADLKALAMVKAVPLIVATSVVFENTKGIRGVHPLPPEIVRAQIKMALEDCEPKAIKIGLIHDQDVVGVLAEEMPQGVPLVLDPIIKGWDGYELTTIEGLKALKDCLIPRSMVVTPNAFEASAISGVKVKDFESAKEAAKVIKDYGAKYVIIKGGHISSSRVFDVLYCDDQIIAVEKDREEGEYFHGLGCTFASSLAGFIAHGWSIVDAFKASSLFASQAIRASYKLRGKARVSNPIELYYKSLDVVRVFDMMYKAIAKIESIQGLEELTPEVGMNLAMCLRNPT